MKITIAGLQSKGINVPGQGRISLSFRRFVSQHVTVTKGVDERGTARTRGTTDHHCELNTFLDVLLTSHLD